MQSYTSFQNFALVILRLIIAAIFLVAGINKFDYWSGMPGFSGFDLFMTRFLAFAEPLGAIAILIGFLTRIAAGCLLIIMLGAIYYSQFVYHIGFISPTGAGWDFPLMILGGCLMLMAFGAGDWSIEGQRRRT